MRVLLASSSPARAQTLSNAGITPLVFAPDVDEDALLSELRTQCEHVGKAPSAAEQVTLLACAKREAVTALLTHPSRRAEATDSPSSPVFTLDDSLVVVACDSMLETGGVLVGKPHTPERARERIKAMRSTSATLWTGHALAVLGAPDEHGVRPLHASVDGVASTTVHFCDLSDAEIDAYVESGEPLHVAGSFTIDGLGGPFVTGIEGDPHNVVGISLPLMRTLASGLGVHWPDLWDHRHT